MNLKSSLALGLALFFSATLFSKNIYVRYDAACMDRLEYRLNGNMAGNGLISYSLRANDAERVVMEIGVESIKRVKRLPRGTKTCGKLKANDLLANSINSDKDKVYIVRKIGNYYTVSPVHLATYIKDSPKQFSMRGNQFDMSYAATDIGVMENNLAGQNSTTKVYFLGSEKQECSDAYLLKKIPEETCKPYTDLTFVPGIGVIEEKTGVNQAEAESNILRLVKVNNIPLNEYLDNICNGNTTEVAVKYEPKPEAATVFQPATTSKPAATKPAKSEVIFPVEYEAPAPEYRPAGSELVYEYDQPQKPLETFRPAGTNCKNLSYPGVHIVQTNQTLFGISRQYNVTVNQLRTWNKLENKDLIQPCASLYVLPPATVANNNAEVVNSVNPEKESFTPRGNNATEVLYRNTPTSTPISPAANRNVNVPDQVYANAAKQSEILYPKSDIPTPASATSTMKAASSNDACKQLAYDGVHIVQKGETLYSIATKNGLTVKQVQKWNNLGEKDGIKPCMSLYVKTPEAVIAAVNNSNNPSSATNEEGYTIPNSDISTGYTNAPSQTQVPTNTNVAKGAANIAASDKMWNSGIEYHIVQKGETLTALAKMYGFTLERFRDINGLGDSNIIRIGQVLRTGNCLCPANGVGPTKSNNNNNNNNSSSSINNTNTSNTGGVISSDNGTIVNQNTGGMQEKGGTANSTIEHSTEYVPVPVPYDYETESVLNNTKRVDGTISYRNGRKVHTVQENETMAMIANKYNLPIDLLRKLNKMEKNEIVIPDMKIYLE